MRYLSLPKRVATELNLSSDQVRNYEYLEDLTTLWRRNIVNPRDTPMLAILAQFKTTVDSISTLRYLNIGNYTGHVLDNDQHSKHTLQRLFQHITINLSPYDDQYPVEEDPCSVFQDGWIMNTVAKSTHLKSLDMTALKLTLLSTIATTLPWGHLLTSLNLSVVGNNNHHNFLLRYETMKKIVAKFKCLKNIILAGTNLCRKLITYICTYLATSIEKVNLATERVKLVNETETEIYR